MPPIDSTDRSSPWRLASAGMMIAAFTLGLGGIGYAIDRVIGWPVPVLAIIGLLVGFAAGLYRLIRLSTNS